MSTAPLHKAIRYEPATHDFACLLDGALIGRAPSWREGEILIERHILEEQNRQLAPKPVPKLALTAREAAEAISVSKPTLFRLINAGRIPAIRLGREVRVPVAALQKWVTEQAETPPIELVQVDPDTLARRSYNRRKKAQ